MLKACFGLLMVVFGLLGQPRLWTQSVSSAVSGTVLDDNGQVVTGATVVVMSGGGSAQAKTDGQGRFSIQSPGRLGLQVTGSYIVSEELVLEPSSPRVNLELHIHYKIPPVHETLVITASALNPAIDQRNAENMWRGTGGPQGILVASVLDPALKSYEGKTIAQIAADEHQEPLDALMDLVVAGKDHVGAVYFTMSDDDVKFAMQQPFVSVGTDAGEVNFQGRLSESKVHPRAYGSFPRILGRYVRDQHLLSLEQAIRKFTSLPAQRMGLRDRGLLRAGAFADITIFDPALGQRRGHI
jgi:Amidohydrolase family/Carboxypeptidase regulatory-like domain